jgi:hypothetical protein
MNRYVGNLPPMPDVFPDYPAPVVRNAGTERELGYRASVGCFWLTDDLSKKWLIG